MSLRPKAGNSKPKKKKEGIDSLYDSDEEFNNDLLGVPYMPPTNLKRAPAPREENPVVWFELHSEGGRKLYNGTITPPLNLGRLYFELRNDLVPVASANFLALTSSAKGVGIDGIRYSYKGRVLHRIVKDLFFQSGDLMDLNGDCSKVRNLYVYEKGPC
jgi:Cyclophilin type peptidyl-prolyl cis-trans isomerase/CLD